MDRPKPRRKPVIGWREWLALPNIGIPRVKAKVDTGARSSALHAFDVEIFESEGKEMVRFKVHPFQRDTSTTVQCVAELHDRRTVRSSAGHETMRPVILAQIELDAQQWTIELTLTRRDAMGFRMLLGRQAIRRRFRVEPGRSFLVSHRQAKCNNQIADPNPTADPSQAAGPSQQADPSQTGQRSQARAQRDPPIFKSKQSERSPKGKSG